MRIDYQSMTEQELEELHFNDSEAMRERQDGEGGSFLDFIADLGLERIPEEKEI